MPTFNEVCSFPQGIQVPENLLTPNRPRSELKQEQLASYAIPWTFWRIYNALHTNLPGTSAGSDLALIGGTFGTSSPSIQTSDLKAAGSTTRYARALIQLPPEYDAGQTVIMRFRAGMLTTIADVAATLDCEVFEVNKEAGIGSDLCITAVQSINSVTLADKDFTITAAALLPGDLLDIRIALLVNDGATVTEVKGIIGFAELLCDIKG